MRRVFILFILVFGFNFVFASVSVYNYSINGFYSPFENIAGEINLTIINEDYNSLIVSNDNDEIRLGDFLNRSGNLFNCSPPDCSNDYSFSSGVTDKSFNISILNSSYVGFVLNGEDIVIKDLSFKVSSDFGVNSRNPLSIDFFESEKWKYGFFSDVLLNKKWGCYNSSSASIGPIIGSVSYCEMINISDSNLLRVGAVVDGNGDSVLKMIVYPDSGTGASWMCNYNPSIDDGCNISSDIGELFSSGEYQICVSSENSVTNYSIYKEDSGENCGFVYSSGATSGDKDYAIFVQGVKYGDSSFLDSVNFKDDKFVVAANKLITERYGGDCSNGCVLPLAFSGVSQNVRIYDAELTFTDNLELDSENNIYTLMRIPVKVDFSGIADLFALGFRISKSMNYIVSFNKNELFKKNITILPSPIVSSLFPLDPPAGVPIKFYTAVDYGGNGSLTYSWDFGDNVSELTYVPYVVHSYVDLKNYTLILGVSAGGNLTSSRKFNITTISPEIAVNDNLVDRRNALDSTISEISKFPLWYKDVLRKLVKVDFFSGELDRLDRAKKNAFVVDDFIKIAEDLYSLDVPISVNVEDVDSPYLLSNINDVNIEPVQIISGSVSGASNDAYAKHILNWQMENVEGKFVSRKISVVTYSDEHDDILMTYSFDVKMKDSREAYFIINRPFSELYFKDSVGARKAGNSTVVILPAESNVSFEFYYKDGEPITYFVSPKLSSVIINDSIDTSCNFNLVCEKEQGENYTNCRSDCKPVWLAVFYFAVGLFFLFILYAVLQIWYKHRYENFLFKDRRQLYNLLMYVTNARARGMGDDRIAAELRSKGWSSERVNYIIKKSIGQRTGLYEIIPIEKVLAYFRNRKAVKIQMMKVATGVQQQMRRNINKSGFPGRI